jgi:hypothetical protein
MNLSRRLLRQRQNLRSLKTKYDSHKEKIALLLAKLVFKRVYGERLMADCGISIDCR